MRNEVPLIVPGGYDDLVPLAPGSEGFLCLLSHYVAFSSQNFPYVWILRNTRTNKKPNFCNDSSIPAAMQRRPASLMEYSAADNQRDKTADRKRSRLLGNQIHSRGLVQLSLDTPERQT